MSTPSVARRRPLLSHLLAALLPVASTVAGCAAVTPAVAPRQLPAGLPATVTVAPDHPPGDPVVLPFDGEAGQEVALRARALAGAAPVLCLASVEAWARVQTGEGTAPRDDLAGDALACDLSPDAAERTSTVAEVLPRDGRYVAVVTNATGAAPGPFALDPLDTGRALALLPDGALRADTLGADRPWALRQGLPVGVHFVRGEAGARLAVRVQSAAFAPYVEVGVWHDAAYTPLVGEGAAVGATAQATLLLPADGVYTVRVQGDRAGGPYAIRATQEARATIAGGGDPAGRYALIVSVADYPGLGREQAGDLVGPRADAEAMRALLVETYGFRAEDVVTLRDAEATREAVVEAFRTHLGQAGPEGTAVFHYAGHGTQLPTEALPDGLSAHGAARAEADGLEEALVLWGRGADVGYLLDHELGALAEGLAARHAVVVLDNCHSGDGTRGEGGRGALRQLPYAEIAGRVEVPQRLVSDAEAVGARRHVLLAAARAEQPSLELDGLAPDGGRAGVFTTLLVAALRDAAPDASFADVVAAVRARAERLTRTDMATYGYPPQEPQVEGAQAGTRVLDALGPRR